MTPDTIRALIAEAALAPSVHNVQPARWRIESDGVTLYEDVSRRLPAADPRAHDAAISLGAAAEGFRLAASRAGYQAVSEAMNDAGIMRLRLSPGGAADPLAQHVAKRRSWRAAFRSATEADRAAARGLAGDDASVLIDPALLLEAGTHLDAASWRYLRDDAFRRELLSWMRLSRRHPDWSRDGLNAEAMAMSRIAATGAGLVLGPLFAPLARIGLARPLLAEGSRIARDVAVVLFHRPSGEPPIESGAHFYRLWLRLEAAGFGASVLAALADDPEASRWATNVACISTQQRLISAFRIGRLPETAMPARARLPLDELIVRAA